VAALLIVNAGRGTNKASGRLNRRQSADIFASGEAALAPVTGRPRDRGRPATKVRTAPTRSCVQCLSCYCVTVGSRRWSPRAGRRRDRRHIAGNRKPTFFEGDFLAGVCYRKVPL